MSNTDKTLFRQLLRSVPLFGIVVSGCVLPPVKRPVATDRMVIRNVPDGTLSSSRSANPRQGCFVGQMGEEPWADRVAEASVRLNAGGSTGSGFVVADSADAASPHLRILTAGHVVDGEGSVSVYAPSGTFLGTAFVTAHPAPNAAQASAMFSRPVSDEAVLSMATVRGPEYDAIEGVELSPNQPTSVLSGSFSDPSGIEGGTSGAAVVDPDGKVVGVAIARGTYVPPEKGTMLASSYKTVSAGSYRWDEATKRAVPGRREVKLPRQALAFADPITDPSIRAGLGAAGARLVGRGRTAVENVQIPGYPLNVCVVFRGNMKLSGG